MRRLNITKEQFNESKYFQDKYGKLEYVSESGKMYKTDKGRVLKFTKESADDIENDPAYECPHCGSHNCEFDDANSPTDYFDGSTLIASYYCLDCGHDYDVTFELKFKGNADKGSGDYDDSDIDSDIDADLDAQDSKWGRHKI